MNGVKVTLARHRGNDYGATWLPTWPHISLGVSAHLHPRFGHVSIHLPIGVVVLGCTGATTHGTSGGVNLTETLIQKLVREAENGYRTCLGERCGYD